MIDSLSLFDQWVLGFAIVCDFVALCLAFAGLCISLSY